MKKNQDTSMAIRLIFDRSECSWSDGVKAMVVLTGTQGNKRSFASGKRPCDCCANSLINRMQMSVCSSSPPLTLSSTFIFIDEDFKRPFFTAYVKTCMLTVYMVRYLVFEKPVQISAVSYALYITLYTRYQERNGEIGLNLMFGTIGMMAAIGGTPLLYVFDVLNVEKLHPLPTREEVGMVVLSALFGTLLGDYLWLTAAGLTDSLLASLSLTLAIPFSFIADAVIRGNPPTGIQLLAAIPITVSFVGAALVDYRKPSSQTPEIRHSSDDEGSAALLDDDDS
ncbi:putative membrane protein [Teladorsagia circumcincta]|uniref:Solute carrier family 35 member F5 n=1 Tax=Teladorsagia circumcincta TaxID=45464 RepID=A0A2G9UUK7_TELCI|nr:putative membrane protein [Teladorsagia circumcincta]